MDDGSMQKWTACYSKNPLKPVERTVRSGHKNEPTKPQPNYRNNHHAAPRPFQHPSVCLHPCPSRPPRASQPGNQAPHPQTPSHPTPTAYRFPVCPQHRSRNNHAPIAPTSAAISRPYSPITEYTPYTSVRVYEISLPTESRP
ncbi:hypothetical protein P280DRAFT_202601 [Massarina eburnea CBS 473.64]|uniref:Uncharacterized protein n=1 Tax=Massarina eburnea CBS 473.64 TaxID=1395130 RepID=A0A6A6RI79_9PLEO|nr:hypothetical protein P280DRAFT_202601 [Massarina eburnea CBS 473.64]